MSELDPKQTTKSSKKRPLWLIPVIAAVLAAVAAAAWFLIPWIQDKQTLELHPQLQVEAGETLPDAQAFLAEEENVTLSYGTAQVDTSVPGTYRVTVLCDGKAYDGEILVVDTVAPTGSVKEMTVLQKDMPEAADFVTDIQDATQVTVTYGVAPSAYVLGQQQITVVLTDLGGNETTLSTALTVIIDTQAPVISGVQNKLLYQGGTVAYRTGVTVSDDQDPAPQLTIDSSTVDLSTPGQYQVTYTATDASGNTATVTSTITVMEKKEDYVEIEVIQEMGREILSKIITEDMTDRDKVVAIYRYIRRNHGYGDGSDKSDWMQGAYVMMKKHGGDCFNYFALCKLLLELEGIPNIDVEKVQRFPGDSRHYWSLVSVDGGKTYYHVDTTPRYNDPIEFLLVTDAYMDAYSEKHHLCFNRDMSLYPATPEE